MGAISPRSQKEDGPCRLAYSALEAGSRGQLPARAGGNPGAGPSRRGPPRQFVERSYVPCAGRATAPAISECALDSAPVDGPTVAGPGLSKS